MDVTVVEESISNKDNRINTQIQGDHNIGINHLNKFNTNARTLHNTEAFINTAYTDEDEDMTLGDWDEDIDLDDIQVEDSVELNKLFSLETNLSELEEIDEPSTVIEANIIKAIYLGEDINYDELNNNSNADTNSSINSTNNGNNEDNDELKFKSTNTPQIEVDSNGLKKDEILETVKFSFIRDISKIPKLAITLPTLIETVCERLSNDKIKVTMIQGEVDVVEIKCIRPKSNTYMWRANFSRYLIKELMDSFSEFNKEEHMFKYLYKDRYKYSLIFTVFHSTQKFKMDIDTVIVNLTDIYKDIQLETDPEKIVKWIV